MISGSSTNVKWVKEFQYTKKIGDQNGPRFKKG